MFLCYRRGGLNTPARGYCSWEGRQTVRSRGCIQASLGLFPGKLASRISSGRGSNMTTKRPSFSTGGLVSGVPDLERFLGDSSGVGSGLSGWSFLRWKMYRPRREKILSQYLHLPNAIIRQPLFFRCALSSLSVKNWIPHVLQLISRSRLCRTACIFI